MNFFVRTQDKTKIAEINFISYEENKKTTKTKICDSVTEETTVTTHKIVGGNRTLGEYQSKERCLEIIDEVQNAISIHTSNAPIIYNMPEN